MRRLALLGSLPLLIASLAPALSGCAHRDAAPTTEGPSETLSASATSVRLIALGDSFTIGTGSSPDQAFPARLVSIWAPRCTVELRNLGVNGYTSKDVIDRELPVLDGPAPTWITLAVGANDLVRGVTKDVYRQHVRIILAAAARVVPKGHVLVLPQPDWPKSTVGGSFSITSADVERYDTVLHEEADAVDAKWLDLKPLMRAEAAAQMLADDGLHPNAEAHAAWAEAITKVVDGCAQ